MKVQIIIKDNLDHLVQECYDRTKMNQSELEEGLMHGDYQDFDNAMN
jgi:hypothetical protein